MKVKYVSIFTIVLVLVSGVPSFSGPGVINNANAKYATNTQTQTNSNECDTGTNCGITSPQSQGDSSASAATNTQISGFNESQGQSEPPRLPSSLQTNQTMLIYHPREGGWLDPTTFPPIGKVFLIDLPAEVKVQEAMSIEMTFFDPSTIIVPPINRHQMGTCVPAEYVPEPLEPFHFNSLKIFCETVACNIDMPLSQAVLTVVITTPST